MRKKISLLLFCAAAMALVLSGCFAKTLDELYALPKHSDQYYDLQQAIDKVMTDGAEYCAPVSGVNQQSVQLADLDGDGGNEAIVFLKTDSEKPLNAYIFDQVKGHYQVLADIEGSGTGFESVEYVQLNDKPGVEIIIGRQLSDQVLKSMSAYTLTDGHVVELMSANYTQYLSADLDGDGHTDIFLLRFDAEERKGVAELYRYRSGQMEREKEASMSTGVEAVKRIVAGYMAPKVPAVFVASVYESSSILTDIFAFRDGSFQNVSTSDNGLSVKTVRNYFVYATDIDGDSLIELPELVTLPSVDGDTYSIIHWYNLGLDGGQTVKLTTYHNFSSGWYVTLPDEWNEQIAVSKSGEVSGVRGLVFSRWDAENRKTTPIFTIYAFSGDDRSATASAGGRFILAEKGDVTYAAKLGTDKWAKALTQEKLKSMFNFIHIDWNSGET